MAKQVINVGAIPNDGTGDTLRLAGQKINNNFTELYDQLGQVPVASGSQLGGIKVGANLTIDESGILSANPGAYTLPYATTTVLGGVKVDGSTINVNGSGVISANVFSGSYNDLVDTPAIPADLADLTDNTNLLGSSGNPFDQDLNTTNEVTFAGVNADGSVSLLGPEGLHNVILTNSGIAGPGLRITIPEAGLGTSHDFYIDASQGIPMIQFPDGYFQTTAFKGEWTALNGQLYAEAATDSSGETFGGNFNGSTQTAIEFGPDELNIGLFNITTVATGTITASSVGTSTYSITLNTGTVSPTLTAWAVSPTDIDTAYATAATFHYLGELVTDNGDGTYLFSQVILETDTFPAGTEIRFFDPDGTIRTPADPLSMVWATGASTNVTGVLVFGNQIYNSSPVVVFVSDADVTGREFPVLIQTVGYTDSYATHELDPDKGFRLRSENSDFFIEADNGKPIVVQTGGNQWIFSGDGSLTFPDATVQTTAFEGLPNSMIEYDAEVSNRVEVDGTSARIRFNTQLDGPSQTTFEFNPDGSIVYPGDITQSYQDFTICPAGVDTVIYTATGQFQHALKLFVMVEGTPDGGSVWETQACDIIAVRGYTDNVVHVTAYGVTYSSASAFATFDGRWNATTSRIEIVCRPTSLTNEVVASVHAIEMTSND